MTNLSRLQLILFSFIVVEAFSLSSSHASQSLPLETFLKKSDYLEIKISPDGEHFAARVRDGGRVFLAMVRTSDGKVVGGINPGPSDEISSVIWANNKRLIYTFADKDARNDFVIHTGELFGVDLNGKKAKLLAGYRASDDRGASRIVTKESSPASHYVLNTLPNERNKILIIEYPWTLRGNAYYDNRNVAPIVSKLNIITGKKTHKEKIPKKNADVFADDQGRINFMTWPTEDGYYRASYRGSHEDEWIDISEALGGQFDDLIASSINKDGTKAYFTGQREGDQAETLYEFDLKSKTLKKVFNNDLNLHSWEVNNNGEPIVGISFPDEIKYHYADTHANSSASKMHKSLVKGFKGQQVWLESQTEKGDKHIFKLSSSVNPGEYFVYDREMHKADFIWANYSWIDIEQMKPKQSVHFKVSDGVKISGYLTMPEINNSEQAPLVVVPHGGPHGVREYPFFDYETQLLANRGYAVLQVNFRGSGGYTPEFMRSGYKKWGTRMIDDILDATQILIKRNDIDENKVCIFGASYGGYAALTSAAREPSLFNCAAGYVGVYDLEAMHVKGDIPNNFGGSGYLDKAIGTDIKRLREQSPIYMADKIKAKVLLIHGDKDERVPSYHSKEMRKALKNVGNDPEWLSLGSVGHGAQSLKNRLKVYTTLLKFLETNIHVNRNSQ